MAIAEHHTERHEHEKRYFFEVDGIEYEINRAAITGGEIMQLAGIPADAGLLEILDDGTQRQVPPDEVIRLKLGHRFKKRPRFKRG